MGIHEAVSPIYEAGLSPVMTRDFQVVIVGASIAGCFTALKLAQRGIRVAIIDKQSIPESYKKLCSHLIHPAGSKYLAELGLLESLLAAGGQGTYLEVINRGNYLYYPLNKNTSANNIERRHLDPKLRDLLGKHANITTFYGYKVESLQRSGHQITGITARGQAGDRIAFHCPLVIAADGRKSRVARLDQCRDHLVANHRIAMFSYFKAHTTMTQSKVWVLDKGDSYVACFPNDDRILLSCYVPEARLDEIRQDPQGFYLANVRQFVEKQGVQIGEQLDDLFIAKDTSTLYRFPRSKGLVFVGDAYLAADPLTGIGCSWAMSSASLLSACIGGQIPSNTAHHRRSGKIWKTFRLNAAIRLYQGLHHIKFLLPAYAMAWLSLKGKWVFNESIFGTLSRMVGDHSSR